MTEETQQVQEENTSTETQNQDDVSEATGAAEETSEKRLSQSEVDDIVAKRLSRERKKLQKELKEQADEEAKRARMDETERLKLEKEEAHKAAKAAATRANERIVKAEAKAQAAMLGIKPERVKYAIKLADLSDVDVEDDGEPDEAAIKSALEQVISDLPELVGSVATEEEKQTRRSPDASKRIGVQGDAASQSFNDLLRSRGLTGGVQ